MENLCQRVSVTAFT